MKITQYMVDAFTEQPFHGNQAAVCTTDTPLPDDMMQNIAIENNYSETAFLVPEEGGSVRYSLRWFTPGGEIDLCGHATLASAFVVGNFLEPEAHSVVFDTKSGELICAVDGSLVSMDMPAYEPEQIPVTDAMEKAFGTRPLEAWLARDLVCVLPNEQAVRNAHPDASALTQLDGLLQVVTARADAGTGFDCVTRCFAPKLSVYEDPVTGSSHCAVVPIWVEKLDKEDIRSFQASERTGILQCKLAGNRVCIAGPAALYATAELNL